MRQDNKFEDLMNQINKKNAERDTQQNFEYAQMAGANMSGAQMQQQPPMMQTMNVNQSQPMNPFLDVQ